MRLPRFTGRQPVCGSTWMYTSPDVAGAAPRGSSATAAAAVRNAAVHDPGGYDYAHPLVIDLDPIDVQAAMQRAARAD